MLCERIGNALRFLRVAAPSIRIVPWTALASCWPLPQQLLPVSATGGGHRRCWAFLVENDLVFRYTGASADAPVYPFHGKGRKGERQAVPGTAAGKGGADLAGAAGYPAPAEGAGRSAEIRTLSAIAARCQLPRKGELFCFCGCATPERALPGGAEKHGFASILQTFCEPY